MMKLINAIIGLTLCLFVGVSCVDDNTVNEFKSLNEVTIEGLADKYSVMLYNNLQIIPTLTTSQNDESKLSYAWYVYTSETDYKADTLSYERNLDILAEPSILTPGEDYTLSYRVTDNETGVFYP